MALATSNLSVNSILTTLGVSTAKAIFYIGSTLKTAAQLGSLVNKDGLNSTYCPGADATARLANLLADRKLSYFKGYNHATNYLNLLPNTFNVSADASTPSNPQVSVAVNGATTWSALASDNWITLTDASGTGNGVFYITFAANTDPVSREASITVTASNGLEGVIQIYQDPS